MHKWQVVVLLYLAVNFLSPPFSLAESEEQMITKDNQAEKKCSLTVEVNDWLNMVTLKISIPKDDKRLERLQNIRFVLGTNGSPWPRKVIVPIKVPETLDGAKRFQVSVQKSQLHDSFIEFICRWANPRLSSLDICYLKLASYVDNREKD